MRHRCSANVVGDRWRGLYRFCRFSKSAPYPPAAPLSPSHSGTGHRASSLASRQHVPHIARYQLPPRAVATPRSLRASVMACKVVAPALLTGFMIGSTVPAKRSASALPASPPLPRMASRFGLPSFTPRTLAAASADLVRCEISVRSCQVRRWAVDTKRNRGAGHKR
jgi:hypothetical protein